MEDALARQQLVADREAAYQETLCTNAVCGAAPSEEVWLQGFLAGSAWPSKNAAISLTTSA